MYPPCESCESILMLLSALFPSGLLAVRVVTVCLPVCLLPPGKAVVLGFDQFHNR